MRKTFYFDKESDDILKAVPQKKQSHYTREAVKEKHKRELQKETPIIKEAPKISSRLI